MVENYSIAQTFKILSDDSCNILKHFTVEEYRIIRRRMIDCILSNDMSQHQKVLSEISNRIEEYHINNGNNFELIYEQEDTSKLFKEQQICLNFILHVADILYIAKPEKIAQQWIPLIYEELFKQSDLEKELGIQQTHLCDRESTNINEAELDYINYIAKPSLDILITILPETQGYMVYLNENYEKYKKLVNEKNSD